MALNIKDGPIHQSLPTQRSKMRTTASYEASKLRREELTALQVLRSNLDCWREKLTRVLTLETLTMTDSKIFIKEAVKTATLPKSCGWLWNQSRSRKTISLSEYQICFYKLNTRTSKSSPRSPPPYKLWVFNIRCGQEKFSFLWCEKGEPLSSPLYSLYPTHQTCVQEYSAELVQVTLSELSFLRPFVSPITASSFGW